ncbi:MAG: serine/threonine-protein kinase [Proteobacteria bacterium]|nr:serine/threonine-protein kinase [Pseudomonadota bacterium]
MNNSEDNTQFKKWVKDLFDLCVDANPQEQKSIITNSKVPDKVKEMVTSLLNFQDDKNSPLTGTIKKSIDLSLGEETLKAGDLIDQYKLIKPIGAGGQGEVWLAQRNDEEFSHQVAIKFIKLSHNQRELSRFQTERELLASLRHANIAHLIGGGTYQNNRVYMILEWVDGLSILDYARKNLITIKDYLLCFSQLCQAVGFAHSNGIIHRDIKPSNIIVTTDGTVKLLDFGIAKSLEADVTNTKSEMMMTFAYSSPEQINGQPVSTASDIYALGLILYELLTCKQAQDHTTESPADMVRSITDITPVVPSKITADEGLDFTPKQLQGDLDNLVMMAIRKEPARRYATVIELVTDIQNYLSSKPLLASGDSLGYKFHKLLKRNRIASVFAIIIMAFLMALPIYMYQTNLEIKNQRDIANETSDFLINILKGASPLGVNGKETKLADVLAMGERQIEYDFNDQLPLKAKMYDTLAVIQHNIGNNEKALEHYQKSERIYIDLNDREGQLKSLGQQALYATRLGQTQQAKDLLSKADTVAHNVSNPTAVAWHQIRKATLMHENGDFDGSYQLLSETLKLLETNTIKTDELLGRLYYELSIAVRYKDKILALEYSQKSLDFANSSVGYNHPIYQSRLVSQVHKLILVKYYKQARTAINESLLLAERLYSKQHKRYADVLAIKGVFHHDLGEFNQAESDYKQSIEIYKTNYGEDNVSYATGINNLAYLYEDMGKYPQAEILYRQSIESRKKLDPDNIMRVVSSQANLARLLVKLKKHSEAKAMLPTIIEQYAQHKRSNLYNHLTVAAVSIQNGNEDQQCKKGMRQINELLPDLEKQSVKGWRRMYAELWIGEMAVNCGEIDKGLTFLNAALGRSKAIYQPGVVGQQLIAKKVENLLTMVK